VLCAGDQTRGAVWADLDLFAPLFASRQKVEKIHEVGIDAIKDCYAEILQSAVSAIKTITTQ
jgi:hypothetical protein